MAKITISGSINVPYSFIDKSTGEEINGSTIYAMVSDGYGMPKVVKCTDPLTSHVVVDRDDLTYDYKGRLKTAHL